MSNDLISRSALISHIESERRQYGEDYDIEQILGDIEDAPNAYDWDKVVEQLEEAKEKIASEDYCRNINEKESCLHKDCYKCCAEHLIEIVKGGGVTEDVCEWKSAHNGEFIQNPHTKRLYSNEPSMKNIYCNTCGKKIKAVE